MDLDAVEALFPDPQCGIGESLIRRFNVLMRHCATHRVRIFAPIERHFAALSGAPR
jgi:hypothetical protein